MLRFTSVPWNIFRCATKSLKVSQNKTNLAYLCLDAAKLLYQTIVCQNLRNTVIEGRVLEYLTKWHEYGYPCSMVKGHSHIRLVSSISKDQDLSDIFQTTFLFTLSESTQVICQYQPLSQSRDKEERRTLLSSPIIFFDHIFDCSTY